METYRRALGSQSNMYAELSDENPVMGQSNVIQLNPTSTSSSVEADWLAAVPGMHSFLSEAASLNVRPIMSVETLTGQENSSSMVLTTPKKPSEVGTS